MTTFTPSHLAPAAASAAPGPRSLPDALRPHLPAFLAGAIALGGIVWLVTYGTGRLLDAEVFGRFYDAQAQSLLSGHWDVPYDAIAGEAFVRDGKNYGYFGFAPALPRIVLNALVPAMAERWSRLSVTLAALVSLVYAYRLLLEARAIVGADGEVSPRERAACAAFVLTVGLGSTLVFLASRSYIFHEALAWGGACALACHFHALRYLRTASAASLAAACGLCFLAFFCRPSVGGGAVMTVFLVGMNVLATRAAPHGARGWRQIVRPLTMLNRWRDVPPARHAVVALAAVLAVVATYVAINRAKFRTWFEGTPLRYYEMHIAQPERLARTDGKQMSVVNVRSCFKAYFSPNSVEFKPSFPWVYATHEARLFPEARMDIVEPHTSLPASTPALTVLALLGLIATARVVGRRPRDGDAGSACPAIPVLGAAAGGGIVLAADALSQRYLHDFFPFLVVAGALGLHALLAARRQALVMGLVAPAVAFSIWANCAMALVYQRVIVWGIPDGPQAEFHQMRKSVDGALDGVVSVVGALTRAGTARMRGSP